MRRAGYLAVSAAAVLWAFGGTYARTLIDRGASPVEITEARAWLAAIVLGIFVAARGGFASNPKIDRRNAPVFIAFGLAIAAANYTYYRAIQSLPVAVAIVVQYTAPALVVLWLAAARRNKPSGRVVAALALALGGVALLAELPRIISTGHAKLSAVGFLAAGVSAVAFAAYIVLGERIRATVAPDVALFRGFAVASVFWLAVQLFRGTPHTLTSARFVPGILLIGAAATIAPFLLFIWGLGHIDASRAGIVSTLEPLSAALLAYVWLHQTLSALQLTGAAMVVAGIAIVQFERRSAAPVPNPPN